MPGGPKRPRKEEEAIAALLTEATIEAAAAKCRISVRTLKGWLKDPSFLSRFRAERRRIVDAAVVQLQTATKSAVKTLKELLDGAHQPTRARAAATILAQAIKGVETSDLLARIEELERVILNTKGRGHERDGAGDQGEAVPPGAGAAPAPGEADDGGAEEPDPDGA